MPSRTSTWLMEPAFAIDLQRFKTAQQFVYPVVAAELSIGRRVGDWMPFIFPQLIGLDRSPMARRFAITSLAEAQAYLADELLGPRLRACTKLVMAIKGKSAFHIFQAPGDKRFRACMTLFALAAPDDPLFEASLAKYFESKPHSQTLAALSIPHP